MGTFDRWMVTAATPVPVAYNPNVDYPDYELDYEAAERRIAWALMSWPEARSRGIA